MALPHTQKGVNFHNLHQEHATKSRFTNFLLLMTMTKTSKTSILYFCKVCRLVKIEFLYYYHITMTLKAVFLYHCSLFLSFNYERIDGFCYSYHSTTMR